MTGPVGVGIVGCGRVAGLHLAALAGTDAAEAVAVTDADPAAAQRVGATHGVAVRAGTAQLVADPRVELVAVCTPPAHHVAVVLQALDAGRHVLCEKPLALDDAGASRLCERAAASGLVAATGFNLRSHRQVVLAREALAERRLGRLRMVRAHWTAAARPPGWRGVAAEGGGVLWEVGSHVLDLWRHLAGEPLGLHASGDAEVLAIGARTAEGVVLSATLATGTSDANEVELVGERGRLVLTIYRGDGPAWAPVGRAAGGPAVRLRALAGRAGGLPDQVRRARGGGDFRLSYRAQWEALARAVREGAPPPASLDDGRAAVRLALAVDDALAR